MVNRKKPRRARRAFTPEFKAEAVRLVQVGDRPLRQVARDLDLTETALRDWVKRAEGFVPNSVEFGVAGDWQLRGLLPHVNDDG